MLISAASVAAFLYCTPVALALDLRLLNTTSPAPSGLAKQSVLPVKQPILPSKKPALPAKKPVVAAKKPVVHAKKPAVAAKKPIPPTTKPALPAKQLVAPPPEPSTQSKSTSFPLQDFNGLLYEPGLQDTAKTPGGSVTKIRYGPMTIKPGQRIPDFPYIDRHKPCIDCWVVAFQAGLEYADGREANTEDGIWFHHANWYNLAVPDLVCPLRQREKFFSTGNERGTRRTNANGNWGYYVSAFQPFLASSELMNMGSETRVVYPYLKYEWLSGPVGRARGYQKVRPLFLDVAGACHPTSDLPAKTGVYTYNGTWVSTTSGVLLDSIGHMHDGGTEMNLYINGQHVCRSRQGYSSTTEKSASAHPSTHSKSLQTSDMSHIVAQEECREPGPIKKGDTLLYSAQYDSSLHHQMKNEKGEPEPVMGVFWIWVGAEPKSRAIIPTQAAFKPWWLRRPQYPASASTLAKD